MYDVRATQGLRARLRKSDEYHLAHGDELGHRAHVVLGWCFGIDAVLVMEIAIFSKLKCLRLLSQPRTLIQFAAYAANADVVLAVYDAELGGEHHAVTPILGRALDQLFIYKESVHVCGIEKVRPSSSAR